jgi:hypothetical protein
MQGPQRGESASRRIRPQPSRIRKTATGEIEDATKDDGKNAAAVGLGTIGAATGRCVPVPNRPSPSEEWIRLHVAVDRLRKWRWVAT